MAEAIDAAGRRTIRARTAPADGLTVLISRSHLDKETTDAFLKSVTVKETVVAGSSLKFGRIAEGLGDLYVRLGRTMEWDTAAGHAVLEAAGGRVETLDGKALGYGKAGFENPHFLARGRAG
jgi:3'(2'), 5'-bisphosphate nucleotidase